MKIYVFYDDILFKNREIHMKMYESYEGGKMLSVTF